MALSTADKAAQVGGAMVGLGEEGRRLMAAEVLRASAPHGKPLAGMDRSP